ncbi:MAG: SprT family zinc-dependent metalloprotease [Campylobacterota bacterium]|nr:SprT family zinc-dependent metalloprotease [Campylobacterota bacterium]
MNKILFKDLNVEHICKPRLKNSYISVSNELIITLKTPRVSQSFLNSLLLEKEPWIRKQLVRLQDSPPQKINIEDELLLFGEIHSIDIKEAKFLRQKLQALRKTEKKNILKCYDDFYKHYSSEYLRPRVEHFADIMELRFDTLKFRKMRSRWGSCSSKRTITLNSQLLKVKKELIDYVIVHELAHLVHMNHSKKFHALVESYLPSSKILRRELRGVSLPSF